MPFPKGTPEFSHQTVCWREMDSNFQFLVARLSTVMGDGPVVPRSERICCGTEGSNPSPSRPLSGAQEICWKPPCRWLGWATLSTSRMGPRARHNEEGLPGVNRHCDRSRRDHDCLKPILRFTKTPSPAGKTPSPAGEIHAHYLTRACAWELEDRVACRRAAPRTAKVSIKAD